VTGHFKVTQIVLKSIEEGKFQNPSSVAQGFYYNNTETRQFSIEKSRRRFLQGVRELAIGDGGRREQALLARPDPSEDIRGREWLNVRPKPCPEMAAGTQRTSINGICGSDEKLPLPITFEHMLIQIGTI